MSVRVLQSSDDDLIVYDVFGVVTIDEVMACRQTILQLPPEVRHDLSQFVLCRDTASIRLTPVELRQFAMLQAAFAPGARRVYLVPDPIAFSLARMYASVKEGASGRFQFVETIEEAASLLGVTTDVLDGILNGERGETLRVVDGC